MAAPASTIASERRFGRQVVLFVTLGYLAVLVAAGATALVVVRSQSHAAWVSHTYQVEREIESTARQGAVMRSEAMLAAYRHRPRSAQYADARRTLLGSIDTIAKLTADNPRQQARIPQLRDDYRRFIELLDGPIDDHFMERLDALDVIRAKLSPTVDAMRAEEQRLLGTRVAAQRDSIRRFWIVVPVVGFLLLAVGVASVLAIRRFTGDLARSKEELETLNVGLEDAVRVRTRDLQRANEEIQRFAYIVSHDLRSPLVNVMGFTAELDASRKLIETLVARAELEAPALVTPEVKLAAREDLPEAIGFIRSATQRMDRLINAILRLSREGRRTLTPELLDTTAIIEAGIGSMRHRTEELGVDVAVEGKLPVLTCDRVAFEQIMNNLIENAVKYLKPGCAGVIRIRGSAARGRAIYEVVDNGRGVDPRDHERIFDLFRRSGVQDQPGEGIGLAHVRALAHRLGGTVDVRSELDKGATFVVNLPVRFAGDKEQTA